MTLSTRARRFGTRAGVATAAAAFLTFGVVGAANASGPDSSHSEAATTRAEASITPTAVTPPVSGLYVTGPEESNGLYTLHGTGVPTAFIIIDDANGTRYNVIQWVAADGTWSTPVPSYLVPPLKIYQSGGDGWSDPVVYDVAPLPIVDPIVALSVLPAAGLGVAGVALYVRKRRAKTTVPA